MSKVQVIENLPFQEYLEIEAVSNSFLGKLYGVTPARAKVLMNEYHESRSMSMGNMLHSIVLEPELVGKEYLVIPEGLGRNTKAGKAWFEASEATGKHLIKYKDAETARAMSHSVKSHPAWFHGGMTEVTLLWTDDDTGLKCKCRIDKYCPERNLVIDIKNTKDASNSDRGFSKSINDYGYHRQHVFYSEGIFKWVGAEPEFTFLAVENFEPYLAVQYELDDTSVDVGRIQIRELMNKFKDLRGMASWPGYPTDKQYISLPSWVLNEYEGEV